MQGLRSVYRHFTDKSPPGSGSVELSRSNRSTLSPISFEQLLSPSLDLAPVPASTHKLDVEKLQPLAQRLDLAPNEPRAQRRNSPLQRPIPTMEPAAIAPFPLPTIHFSADDRCRCRKITVHLFEEVCSESANSSQAAIDVLLRYIRRALSHCTAVLDCDRCSDSACESSSNMLLATAAQYMSTICERSAMCYANMRRRNEERQRSLSEPLDWGSGVGFADGEGWDSPADGSAAVGDMWFSTYHIKSSEERLQVTRCLVIVQLADFSRLMERLKRRAGGRSGCLVLLADAEKRINAAKSILLGSTKATSSLSFPS